MANTRAAGTALKGQNIAIDVDGKTPADFAKESAKMAGLDQAEWFKRFNEGMHQFGPASVQGMNVTDAESFDKAIYTAQQKSGSGPLFSMLKNIHKSNVQMIDPAWQPTTTAKWTSEKSEWQRVSDKEAKAELKKNKAYPPSWVDAPGGPFKYVTTKKQHDLDPETVPYIARKGFPNGGIFRLTDPNNPDSQAIYAIRGDSPPDNSLVEISPAAARPFGVDPNPLGLSGNPPKLQADYLGQSDLLKSGHQPTFDEIQREGKRLEEEARQKRKKEKKAALTDPKNGNSGAFKVATGEDSVRLGKDKLPAAYADATCLHTGGGHVAEGSDTVCVGKGQWKFARVDDRTSDDYHLVTGEGTVGIG